MIELNESLSSKEAWKISSYLKRAQLSQSYNFFYFRKSHPVKSDCSRAYFPITAIDQENQRRQHPTSSACLHKILILYLQNQLHPPEWRPQQSSPAIRPLLLGNHCVPGSATLLGSCDWTRRRTALDLAERSQLHSKRLKSRLNFASSLCDKIWFRTLHL